MLRRLRVPLLISSGLVLAFTIVSFGFGAATAASGGRPVVGIACTTWVDRDTGYNQKLGNKLCRVEFPISANPTDLDGVIGAYAAAGVQVQPLAGFNLLDRGLPSSSEAQALRGWAERFGPNGSFWQGKANPMPIANIEFGNETSYSYQGSYNGASDPAYAKVAQTYAQRAKDAAQALAGKGVGLLVQLDDAGGWPWVANMKVAVPDLDRYAAGWTVHPYGPDGAEKVQRIAAQAQAAGWSSNVPFYFTEWGIATDDGRNLSDNYGFPTNMTYASAATTLKDSMNTLTNTFGSRLEQVIYYMLTDLRPSGGSSARDDYYGAVKADGSDKGPFTAELRNWLGGTTPTATPAPATAPIPASVPSPTPPPSKSAVVNPASSAKPAPKAPKKNGSVESTLAASTTYIAEWDGRLFSTAGDLRSYITSRGINWSGFLAKHPALTNRIALPSVSWNGNRFYDQASLVKELTKQKISYRRWASTHPNAAATLLGRAVASAEVPTARPLARTAVVQWAGIGFTSPEGLRIYMNDQKIGWNSFLAKHPTIVQQLKLSSVRLAGKQYFSRKALASLLEARKTTLATWSASHPGAAERLMP